MPVLKMYDGEKWNVVGLQGTPGYTGLKGPTGVQGATGIRGLQGSTGLLGSTGLSGVKGDTGSIGLTGIQGTTGPQIIMSQMVIESTKGITGLTPTGLESLNYVPITGLKTTITLTKPSKILSLLALRYRNTDAGSHTVSYLLQSDGETGPFFSDYLPDTRERSEVIFQTTSDLPIGVHNIQAYWRNDTTGRLTQLIRGDLSSIILDGAYGSTGIQGFTGVRGMTGLIGVTGAYGGPAGVTGLMGLTGLKGSDGVTGPGLLGYDTFVKTLPMEEWKAFNVDSDVYAGIPVLRFDSAGAEEIHTTIVVPGEWNQDSDMYFRLGSIINTPLSAGSQLIYRVSYIGFDKTTNVGTLGAYYTDIVTHTLPSPTQFDFVESLFTLDKDYIAGYDYIHLKIQKITGTPNIATVGICSSQLEYPVSIGVGPTGIQGPTGVVGIQGPTGAFGGPAGETGLMGPTGWQGITGIQGLGVTGLIGDTGLSGQTGPQGLTGIQGVTGLQIVMDQMNVERVINVSGYSFTGPEALSFEPITGLMTSITLDRPSKVLSLLYLKYRNITSGSHTVSFLIQSNGETGQFFSDYLADSREKSEVLYQVTSDLPAGTHDVKSFWKIDTLGKQTQLIRGDLTSMVLEGSKGPTGAQGLTGMGIQGSTGAYGGPAGATGIQGIQGNTGLAGIPGATGLGVASFETFEKILPMESWRAVNVDYDVYGDIPVLRFDSVGVEKIDNTIPIPVEWNGQGDLHLKVGVILSSPLTSGSQVSLRLSYKGFNKDTNVGTLTPYYTDTVTKTYASPTQYDFSEFDFTIDRDNALGYEYLLVILEKLTGSPDVSVIGVCSSTLEHGVSVGMGPTGSIGATGIIGIQGPTGAYGGPPGETGLSGVTGLQGTTGIQGLGVTGLVGATGLIGVTGAYGGPPGETGLSGATGLPGPTGWQGETGSQGLIGSTGSQGLQGETGPLGATGPIGITGLIGATGMSGSISEEPIYNTVSRYSVITTSGEEVWVVSSSTVFVGLTWTRSGTTLTVYSPTHGHLAGDRVIIRNTNKDYQVGLIDTVSTDSFTFTTTNTGGASGYHGAYSLGFTFAHLGSPKTGGTMSAPSGAHADCQLISVRLRTGGRASTTYDLYVPKSAVNGAGANNSLSDCYVPDFNVRADADTLSAIAATMNVNSGSLGYEVFTFGALGTLSRIICLHF